jgi:hypothetical protein
VDRWRRHANAAETLQGAARIGVMPSDMSERGHTCFAAPGDVRPTVLAPEGKLYPWRNMMLITGRVGRAAAIAAAAVSFILSVSVSAAYASTSPCGSGCVDSPPVVGGLLAASHGSLISLRMHPAGDPAED